MKKEKNITVGELKDLIMEFSDQGQTLTSLWYMLDSQKNQKKILNRNTIEKMEKGD